MKRKLAVDIDNTIWDLISPWLIFYNKAFDDNLEYKDIVQYDFFNINSKASREDVIKLLEINDIWDIIQPYENTYEYLEKLNNEYELYLVTSTSYKTPKAKFDKLFSLFPFINEDQLILISNKKLLNVDIMIDDCIDNLVGGKYTKLLIDAPYNRDYKKTDIIRIKDLKDAYLFLYPINNTL